MAEIAVETGFSHYNLQTKSVINNLYFTTIVHTEATLSGIVLVAQLEQDYCIYFDLFIVSVYEVDHIAWSRVRAIC